MPFLEHKPQVAGENGFVKVVIPKATPHKAPARRSRGRRGQVEVVASSNMSGVNPL